MNLCVIYVCGYLAPDTAYRTKENIKGRRDRENQKPETVPDVGRTT